MMMLNCRDLTPNHSNARWVHPLCYHEWAKGQGGAFLCPNPDCLMPQCPDMAKMLSGRFFRSTRYCYGCKKVDYDYDIDVMMLKDFVSRDYRCGRCQYQARFRRAIDALSS